MLANSRQGLFDYQPYWAECFGTAPFLPTSRSEMDALGWDRCDVIIVTGDAYVDHPSFGMAVIGRVLEAQGFRVGIIAQPDWQSVEPFQALGEPSLYFGVAAGNMDSLINHYTADRKRRNDDAYSPAGAPGLRPDRAVIVYAQRCREAFGHVPLVIGSIEASLRRIAHYDYWSDKVRRSILLDSGADLLLYGNAERALVEMTHRLAAGDAIKDLQDIRGTAFMLRSLPDAYTVIDESQLPEAKIAGGGAQQLIARSGPAEQPVVKSNSKSNSKSKAITVDGILQPLPTKVLSYIQLPSFESAVEDDLLYAHASRILHRETNPSKCQTAGATTRQSLGLA